MQLRNNKSFSTHFRPFELLINLFIYQMFNVNIISSHQKYLFEDADGKTILKQKEELQTFATKLTVKTVSSREITFPLVFT